VKEHLVNYISYINNILVKVKLIELIELKVGSWKQGKLLWWECGYEVPR
jgi:hypothetical protein